ncbi:YihY/virulence factor BrkB family protein [Actinotalea sp.]|uniref:YihY/virulence factor BrkB family protein n=1 Tax=Actinotalea sp. TaxID=1872145 RepID=UPI00356A1816
MSDRTDHEPRGAGSAHLAASRALGQEPQAPPRSLVARAKAALTWAKGTRPLRANARFGAAGGGVLTGGIAYSALFSLFAGLTLGWTVAMAVLGGNEGLRDSLVRTLSRALPGLIETGTTDGLISPDDLVLTSGLSVAGAVSVVVLVVTAISAMAALRTAVRAMFDAPTVGVNALVAKGRELAGAVGMAVVVLISAVLTTTTGAAASWVLEAVGLDAGTGLALTVLGRAVAFLVDGLTFVLVVVVLAGQHPRRRALLGGAVIAATGIGVVRFLGASVVAGSAERNPLLASFAVIVTLLIWINLIARIVLLAAAWAADPPLETAAGSADERSDEQSEVDSVVGAQASAADGRRSSDGGVT